jgi:hypothetical protein
MVAQLNQLQDGIGDKMAMLVYFWATYLISHVVAFAYCWELTLALVGIVPATILLSSLLTKAGISILENFIWSPSSPPPHPNRAVPKFYFRHAISIAFCYFYPIYV